VLLYRNAKTHDQNKRHFAMLDKTKKPKEQTAQVVIKKYANRRLYDTESSTYVTLEDLAQMVRDDRDFVVFDAKSGDDLTHAVLTQIIVEQESREGGQTLLPIPFLRQLIRFYGDSMGNLVPSYLQFSLETLTQNQETYRSKLGEPWRAGGLETYQEHARNNMKIFEQAMAIWTPFKPASSAAQSSEKSDDSAKTDQSPNEIDALKAELAAMQHRIEKLSQNR